MSKVNRPGGIVVVVMFKETGREESDPIKKGSTEFNDLIDLLRREKTRYKLKSPGRKPNGHNHHR